MSETVKLTIDGIEVSAPAGTTLLKAAAAAGIEIPHLCHDPRLTPTGACRLCLVDIAGERGLQTACTRPAAPGMVVKTEMDLAGQTPAGSAPAGKLKITTTLVSVKETTLDDAVFEAPKDYQSLSQPGLPGAGGVK